MGDPGFAWLEITGKCSLLCRHCYADSGPGGTHGTMDVADWCRVIEETAQMGGRMVQFIGGEPTLHPALPDLIAYALACRVQVEVFSNLAHMTLPLWKIFAQRGVQLATSYYSDTTWEHESITRGHGSHARTRANIAEAVHRSIPLRVGLIEVQDGQRVGQARRELASLGVTNIGIDRLRQVGRGVRDQPPDVSQLCGGCARGKVAIASNGDVWPCFFAHWMHVGNVKKSTMSEILASPKMIEACNKLERMAALRKDGEKCEPESKCHPAENDCEPNFPPGYHSDPKRCRPYYYQDDK